MKLTVISFNIRCCDDSDGHSIAERAPRLERVVGLYDVDVIGFQEFRPVWKPYIDKYFGDHYDMFNQYRNRTTEEESESVPILWRKDRFECVQTGYFWLSDTPEVESRGWDERFNCYRICEYVILCDKDTAECVTFMNTHFGFGDAGQVKSAELIYKYSKMISDHPTIIVGDFNMNPSSAGYRAMVRQFIDVNEATVKDRGCTYHGYHPENREAAHIDYCFVNEKVIPKHYEIMRQTVKGKYPSDHYGICAVIQTYQETTFGGLL